jgi:hypothetical protein
MDRFTADRGNGTGRRHDAPAPLEGQRGVVIGLGTQPLLLEVFGTHTLFRRHYRQLVESALLDLELLPPHVMASGPMPGQRARDFAAAVQALEFGAFDGGLPALEVRNHGALRSRNVTRPPGSRGGGHRRRTPPPRTRAGPPDRLEHQTPPDGDRMKLNPLQNDRAAGVLVTLAAGDALGAGYEFGAPLPDGTPVSMKGGGPFGFAPAEWTDDTSMAVALAEALVDSRPTRVLLLPR